MLDYQLPNMSVTFKGLAELLITIYANSVNLVIINKAKNGFYFPS